MISNITSHKFNKKHVNKFTQSQDTYIKDLINGLRAEAYDVKNCFTRHSFHGVSIASALIICISKLTLDDPGLAFLCVFPILILNSVIRMGTHKYATANRLAGYELHLQRMKTLGNKTQYDWAYKMSNIGWEEAMRSWRIVQGTVFDHILITPYSHKKLISKVVYSVLARIFPDKTVKPLLRIKNKLPDHFWFDVPSLFKAGASYYPGGYLKTVIRVILVITMICFIPFIIFICKWFKFENSFYEIWHIVLIKEAELGLTVLNFIIFTLLFLIFVPTWIQVIARMKTLEYGLNSIHSCGMMWQAIVIAHYRAVSQLKKDNNNTASYRGYTQAISKHAICLARNVVYLHEWMEPPKIIIRNTSNPNCFSTLLKSELSNKNIRNSQLNGTFKTSKDRYSKYFFTYTEDKVIRECDIIIYNCSSDDSFDWVKTEVNNLYKQSRSIIISNSSPPSSFDYLKHFNPRDINEIITFVDKMFIRSCVPN